MTAIVRRRQERVNRLPRTAGRVPIRARRALRGVDRERRHARDAERDERRVRALRGYVLSEDQCRHTNPTVRLPELGLNRSGPHTTDAKARRRCIPARVEGVQPDSRPWRIADVDVWWRNSVAVIDFARTGRAAQVNRLQPRGVRQKVADAVQLNKRRESDAERRQSPCAAADQMFGDIAITEPFRGYVPDKVLNVLNAERRLLVGVRIHRDVAVANLRLAEPRVVDVQRVWEHLAAEDAHFVPTDLAQLGDAHGRDRERVVANLWERRGHVVEQPRENCAHAIRNKRSTPVRTAPATVLLHFAVQIHYRRCAVARGVPDGRRNHCVCEIPDNGVALAVVRVPAQSGDGAVAVRDERIGAPQRHVGTDREDRVGLVVNPAGDAHTRGDVPKRAQLAVLVVNERIVPPPLVWIQVVRERPNTDLLLQVVDDGEVPLGVVPAVVVEADVLGPVEDRGHAVRGWIGFASQHVDPARVDQNLSVLAEEGRIPARGLHEDAALHRRRTEDHARHERGEDLAVAIGDERCAEADRGNTTGSKINPLDVLRQLVCRRHRAGVDPASVGRADVAHAIPDRRCRDAPLVLRPGLRQRGDAAGGDPHVLVLNDGGAPDRGVPPMWGDGANAMLHARAGGHDGLRGDAGYDRARSAAQHSVGARDVAVEPARHDVDLEVVDLVRSGYELAREALRVELLDRLVDKGRAEHRPVHAQRADGQVDGLVDRRRREPEACEPVDKQLLVLVLDLVQRPDLVVRDRNTLAGCVDSLCVVRW